MSIAIPEIRYLVQAYNNKNENVYITTYCPDMFNAISVFHALTREYRNVEMWNVQNISIVKEYHNN